MRYTQKTLHKLEALFHEQGYIVRYEKGNFTSGYCILHDKQVVVINKFFGTEARINSLLEIMDIVEIDASQCSEQGKLFYKQLKKK